MSGSTGRWTSSPAPASSAADDGPGPEASFSSPNGIGYDATRGLLWVNDYRVPFAERTRTRPVSALRRIVLPSLTRTLSEALAAGGADALEAAYRDFKQGRPIFTEVEANRFGYTLLGQDKVAAAIRLFTLNARVLPRFVQRLGLAGRGARCGRPSRRGDGVLPQVAGAQPRQRQCAAHAEGARCHALTTSEPQPAAFTVKGTASFTQRSTTWSPSITKSIVSTMSCSVGATLMRRASSFSS